jgi:hypothetical protein
MALELTGKLIKKLDVQSGSSDRGAWSRQDIIIEIPGQYTRTVCLSLWNEQVNEAAKYNIGDVLKVGFDLSSREYNGKWYTSVRPWKMEREAISAAAAAATTAPAEAGAPATTSFATATEDPFAAAPAQQVDDLPF